MLHPFPHHPPSRATLPRCLCTWNEHRHRDPGQWKVVKWDSRLIVAQADTIIQKIWAGILGLGPRIGLLPSRGNGSLTP